MKFFSFIFIGSALWLSAQAMVVELSEQFGEITSPNYSGSYGDNIDDTWIIVAPENYQVLVYFSVFDLEDSYDEDLGGACVYDFVEIEDSGRRKKFCGNSHQFPADAPIPLHRYRSKNNTMVIRFVTDYSNEESHFGFVAHFIVDDKDECAEMAREVRNAYEDWDELVYCNHFCINTPGSYHCSCRHGFVLHENQHTCKASCENQQITTDEGFVASPDYPQPYSRLTDCDWTITVRPGLSLNLEFSQPFEIEDHFEYDDCVYDYLKVSYGGNEEYYCHGVPNNGSLIETNVREVRLEFHTDNAVELAGFNMSFTTRRQRCNDARNAPQNGSKPPNPKGFYEFEDEIVFSCHPGYNLIGESTIFCLSDGSWSDEAPTCQIKSCGRPRQLRAVPYSRLDFDPELNFTYGDVIMVECNQYYERTTRFWEWRCSEDAVWTPTDPAGTPSDIPVCSPICGRKNGRDNPLFGRFIVGGSYSKPHEWPWMVFLNFGARANVADRIGTCGGFLISPDYVLTAAHCVTSPDRLNSVNGTLYPRFAHAWFSTKNRLNDFLNINSTKRYVRVEEIKRHGDYNVLPYDSDIALLRLAETIVMNERIRPICLPNTTAEFDEFILGDTIGEVAGWGITEHGNSSYLLKHVELPTETHERCISVLQRVAEAQNVTIEENFMLTDNMFCAGYEAGGLGSTCYGDSGGPYAVERTGTSKYYAYGVVSFGIAQVECGTSISYSVFVNLNRDLVTWIHENMY